MITPNLPFFLKICNHLCLEDFIMMTSLSRGKWIPSPLKIIDTSPSKVKDTGMGRMKMLADVIESILGIVYLDFGYHIAMKVGNELRVTLPWDETDISVAVGESGEIDSSVLLDVVEMCTGVKTFNRPKLVDEAFTHPSAIDAKVPSYQRLEWIGDSVLCLCAREWLYKNLGEVTLGDLVLAEGAIVSNETLGFVSMKYGLQQYLNHRDQSLPKRIESYCWNVQEGCGLWGGGMYVFDDTLA
jgi:endoribonuclease Dicer